MDLSELDKEFEKLINQFPEKRRKLCAACGEKMHQQVLNNISRDVKEDTGNLRRGVEKVLGSGGGYAAVKPDYKIAPHTHLIENGRKVAKNGEVRWLEGKHMYRNALNSLADELEREAEKVIEDLVGGFGG